jgi:hypothetical protein
MIETETKRREHIRAAEAERTGMKLPEELRWLQIGPRNAASAKQGWMPLRQSRQHILPVPTGISPDRFGAHGEESEGTPPVSELEIHFRET